MTRSEVLLLKAKSVLSKSRISHRDARLEVGRLLREYLTERLKECDTQTRNNREKMNLSRRWAVRDAADALHTSRRAINEYVRIYNVVRLLSDDGEVGEITYSTIAAFSVLISFPPGMYKRSVNGQGNDPSMREEWFVVDPVDENVGMFRRAVREGWVVEKARSALKDAGRNKRANVESTGSNYHNVVTRNIEVYHPDKMLRVASPNDAVEVLYKMIMNSQNPLGIAERLIQKVRESTGRVTLS